MTRNDMPNRSEFSEYIEYVGADEYDRENGLDGPELPFYLALAAEVGGPVLDLACGTGYLTIPMALAGHTVTGVDLAPEMLELAKQKAASLPQTIRWKLADCRTLDLGDRYRLVTLTGNAFQEFRTRADLEGLLGSVRRHLAPGGWFAFETRFPRQSELMTPEAMSGEWSPETPWRTFEDDQGRTVTVSTSQRYDAISQIVEYAVHRRWQEDGRDAVVTERAVLRLMYPQELQLVLHYNGFAIRHAYGNWDRSPLDGNAVRMIFVCEARP